MITPLPDKIENGGVLDDTYSKFYNHVHYHNPVSRFFIEGSCEMCDLFNQGLINWFGENIASLNYKKRIEEKERLTHDR